MRNLFLASAVAAAFPTWGHCGASSFGEFAGTEPSVRAMAMANAYTGADGDVMGMYYNPAQSTDGNAAGAAFERGYADDSMGAVSVLLPKAAGGFNIGASALYYTSGDMDLYTRSGAKNTVAGEKDLLGALNVSNAISEHFAVGANVKFLKQTLFDEKNDSSLLLDAGLLAKYPWLNVGFAAQNLGGAMDLGSETEYIPSTARGGAYREFALGSHSINAAFDLVKTQNEPVYARLGGEFVYNRLIALRFGYEFQNELADTNQLHFGAGLVVARWKFDYALVPHRYLGATHRFSITCKL